MTLEAVRKAFWSQVALMSCFALASHSRSQDEIFAFKWASLAEQVAQEANGNPTMGNGFSGLFVQPLGDVGQRQREALGQIQREASVGIDMLIEQGR